jgi:hypothetical protein
MENSLKFSISHPYKIMFQSAYKNTVFSTLIPFPQNCKSRRHRWGESMRPVARKRARTCRRGSRPGKALWQLRHGRNPVSEPGGEGRFEKARRVPAREGDGQSPGMEHQRGVGKLPVREAVDAVPQDGAAQMAEVDPELVGAAGAGPQNEQGIGAPGADHPVAGEGAFAPVR